MFNFKNLNYWEIDFVEIRMFGHIYIISPLF